MTRNLSTSLCFILLSVLGASPLAAQWNFLNKPGTGPVYDAQFITDDMLFVCGENGVFKSVNGGSSWARSEQFTPLLNGGTEDNQWFSSSVFRAIHFLDAQAGYAAGWNSVSNSEIIIKTIDGGNSWTISHIGQLKGDHIGDGITDIQFPTTLIGYASSFKGRVLKTIDGGQHWERLAHATTDNLPAIHFFDSNNGIALMESPYRYMKTTDGGASWGFVYCPGCKAINFLNSQIGVFATTYGRIGSTNGNSWVLNPMKITAEDVIVVNATTAYAAGKGIYKTTDGGVTWSLQKRQIADDFTFIKFGPGGSIGIAGTKGGEIYKTTNGGEATVPVVTFTGVTPFTALPEGTLTLTGENLDYIHSVIIGSSLAEFSSTPNSITTVIPGNAVENEKIEIRSKNGSLFSSYNFRFAIPPYISTITPERAIEGVTISLTGSDFEGATAVKFNGISASFNVINDQNMTAVVPAGNASASGFITITTPYGSNTYSPMFTRFKAPTITSISPQIGYRDGCIVITGKGFVHDGIMEVKLNGVQVPLRYISDTKIEVAFLPQEATSGKISLSNPSGEWFSAESFTIIEGDQAAEITGFTPTSGSVGQLVNITGTDLYSLKKIKLNGADLEFEIISDTELRVQIPIFTTSGNFEAIDVNDNPISTTATQFTVLPDYAVPEITGFSPESGPIETEVTIEGKNLYTVRYVYFNGVRAGFIQRDGMTKIRVKVPNLASTGKVKLDWGINTNPTPVESSNDFIVNKNYCVPTKIHDVEMRVDLLSINNQYIQYDGQGNCKTYFDLTDRVVEAKSGVPMTLFIKAGSCSYRPLGDVVYMVYIDFNDDLDFEDEDEMIAITNWPDPVRRNYIEVVMPEGAPTNGTRRMRIITRYAFNESIPVTPCDFLDGSGVAHDFTVKFVDDLTFVPPSVNSVEPSIVTHGSKINLVGANLQHTQRVLIDNQEAAFSYNNVSGKLEITIPENTSAGEIYLITKGGALRVADQLQIIIPPNFRFDQLQDTVGAIIVLRCPLDNDYSSVMSVEHVYFNGAEAEFYQEYSYIMAIVPPDATTGKITLSNQFGLYTNDKIFTVIKDPMINSFFPLGAEMGQSILINGSEFNDITTVAFNGIETLAFEVLSTTQISAKVPYGASHGKITVTNRKSTGISSKVFTILKSTFNAPFVQIPSFNYDTLWDHNTNVLDYDNDGLMDLVTSGVGQPNGNGGFIADNITIYKNAGSGTFSETNIRLKGYNFEFGDFDGNGFTDIITEHGGGYNIYYNSPAGFQGPNIINMLPLNPNKWNSIPHIATVMDYNHDGDLDIILVGWSIAWLDQVNPGQFLLRYIDIDFKSYAFAFADFDRDGDVDILNNDDVFINQNNSYYKADWSIEKSLRFNTWSVTDFNGDGYPDLIGTVENYQGLQLYRNINGRYFEKSEFGEGTGGNPSWADIYNDGTATLITRIVTPAEPGYSSTNTGFDFQLYTLSTSGSGVLRARFPAFPYGAPGHVGINEGLSLLDFENDGDLDLCHIYGPNHLTWPRLYENQVRSGTTGPINEAPTAPTNLTFQIISETEVLLRWDKGTDDHTPANSLNYNLIVKDVNGKKLQFAPKPLGTPYGNVGMALHWSLQNLNSETLYSFQVQAIDQGYRASELSSPVNFRLGVAIKAPSNLVATPTGKTSAQLQWKDNAGNENGFNVEYKKITDSDFGLLGTVNSNVVQFDATGLDCSASYNFRVIAFNQEATSSPSDTAYVDVFLVAQPEIVGNLVLCEGETTELTASQGFSEYKWNNGATGPTIIVGQSGAYRVTVKDQEGCLNYNDVYVTLKPLPIATISFFDGQLVASVGDSYMWFKDGVPLPITTQSFRPSEKGKYKVKVTKNGCSSISDELQLTITGIEYDNDNFLRISPNPTTGIFTVITAGHEGRISIVSPLGIEEYTRDVDHTTNELRIDFTNKPQGLYILNFHEAEGKRSFRLVVNR